MKALIVEDEKMAREQLARTLSNSFPEIEIVMSTDSVSSTVEYLEGGGNPDVIFMDVELTDGNCFDIFRLTEVRGKVIMTTAYDTYAMQAFEVGGIDYLLKPIKADALERAVRRAESNFTSPDTEQKPSYPEYFTIRLGDRIIPVSSKEIAYFYSEDKANYIMTDKGVSYIIESTLEQLEGKVKPESFFRISRGAIIAKPAIINARRHLSGRLKLETKPKAPFEVTVSRARVEEFLKWLES